MARDTDCLARLVYWARLEPVGQRSDVRNMGTDPAHPECFLQVGCYGSIPIESDATEQGLGVRGGVLASRRVTD